LGTIIIACPVTGQDIATGIETDTETFSRIAELIGRAWCSHCQAEHDWSVANARLNDTGGALKPG
jgi:hypothetical protein